MQDEALRLGPPRRGGERGAAEKKIAILEKALSLHPGSDELLLALLHAVGGAGGSLCVSCTGVGDWRELYRAAGGLAKGCPLVHFTYGLFIHGLLPYLPRSQAEAVCDSGELERRWRAVLARHAGSPRLWRAYLHHRWGWRGGEGSEYGSACFQFGLLCAVCAAQCSRRARQVWRHFGHPERRFEPSVLGSLQTSPHPSHPSHLQAHPVHGF